MEDHRGLRKYKILPFNSMMNRDHVTICSCFYNARECDCHLVWLFFSELCPCGA